MLYAILAAARLWKHPNRINVEEPGVSEPINMPLALDPILFSQLLDRVTGGAPFVEPTALPRIPKAEPVANIQPDGARWDPFGSLAADVAASLYEFYGYEPKEYPERLKAAFNTCGPEYRTLERRAREKEQMDWASCSRPHLDQSLEWMRKESTSVRERWRRLAVNARGEDTPKTNAAEEAEIPDYVYEYAPYCWLYSDEPYLPSTLETFLAHTEAFENFDPLPDEFLRPTVDDISRINRWGLHTYTTSIDDPEQYPWWMESAKMVPDSNGYSPAPIYLAVVDKGEYLDAFWFFFYAFNLGNQVLGVRFGNHIGDWEHTAIRFRKKDGMPQQVFYSQHEWGAAYSWKDVEKAKDGKRMYTYAGVGTHAMYPTSGVHQYVLPFGLLQDITDRGFSWDPLQNLWAYVYDPKSDVVTPVIPPAHLANSSRTAEQTKPPYDWFNYIGHFGDKKYPDDDPRQYFFAGEYHYTSGPPGPKDKNLGREDICEHPDRECEMLKWPPVTGMNDVRVFTEEEWEQWRKIRYDGAPPQKWSEDARVREILERNTGDGDGDEEFKLEF